MSQKHTLDAARKRFILSSLNELYKKVPKVKCQGHCGAFCSAIGYESIELMNIEEKHGSFPSGFENPVDNGQTIRCGSLSSENKCSVYDTRPMICRMFGASQMMLQCPVGCELENPGQSKLSPEELMGLLLEVKLLNLKYLNPQKEKSIRYKLENLRENESFDLEKELPEAIYNVPRVMWEKDMDSEALKTQYVLESFTGSEVDMNQYFESKKWRVVKSISQTLKNDMHRGTINIINTDNHLQMEFTREELSGLSEAEIYQKVFHPDLKESEYCYNSETDVCQTCGSIGFIKYVKQVGEKTTCQFCEGEF